MARTLMQDELKIQKSAGTSFDIEIYFRFEILDNLVLASFVKETLTNNV
jgi:hypothetical protein